MAARKRKEYGEHIVSDSKICGGDLTFKGTRVLVKDVLYYVAQGKDWDWISKAGLLRFRSPAASHFRWFFLSDLTSVSSSF